MVFVTIEECMAALVQVVTLINFFNANLAPAEAAKQTARWAIVLDFLFGWLDKLKAKP